MSAQPPRQSVVFVSHCALVSAAAGVQLPGSGAKPTASVLAISNPSSWSLLPCVYSSTGLTGPRQEITRVLTIFPAATAQAAQPAFGWMAMPRGALASIG